MATSNFRTQKRFDLYASEMTDDGMCTLAQDQIDKMNNQLNFFKISLESGYYCGVQTIVDCCVYDFDAEDFLDNPQYYDKQDLFADFGVNSYILKRQILAEINKINNKLLPQLKEYTFDHYLVIARFSNGETFYGKADDKHNQLRNAVL